MLPSTIAQAIVSGIVLGSIYMLVALGLNLIFGVMGILNFAHCQYMMLAMYGSYWLWSLFGIDPYVSPLIIVPLLFSAGFATQRFLIKRVLATPALNQIILTAGLFLVLGSSASLFFTEKFRSIRAPYKDISYSLGGVYIGLPHLIAVIVSIVLVLVLYLLLKRTDFGRSIRAASEDMDGASMCGVNIHRIFNVTFGIGIALVGVAGLLIAPFYPIFPHVGEPFLISSFVIVVLGGLGSFKGCLAGSYIIAITESLIAATYIPVFKYVGSLIAFMIVLLLKPTGLFGTKGRHK